MNSQTARPTVSLFVPLVMSLLCWIGLLVPNEQPARHTASPTKVSIQVIEQQSQFAPAQRAIRAMVFFDSPQSTYAARNSRQFQEAAHEIAASGRGIEFYWVKDGFEDWCRDWLRSHGERTQVLGGRMLGNYGGVLLWLENGTIVDLEYERKMPPPKDLTQRTLHLWWHRSP